jgi:hypothetical protein
LLSGSFCGAAHHRFDSCHNLLGVKRFDHVIIRSQLQTQNLVEGLALAVIIKIGQFDVLRISRQTCQPPSLAS